MVELLVKGGPVMIPILLGSVIALAVFIERMWALRRRKVVPDDLGDQVRSLVGEGRLDGAVAVCERADAAIARIFLAGLRLTGKPRELVKERIEEVGRRETVQLERYVGVLGVIAALEPLLGLLGTVTGMIKVFQNVVKQGLGDPRILASGIWEALITTAAGLVVAIPTYILWRWLLAKVRDRVMEMEDDAVGLMDLLTDTPSPPPRSDAPAPSPETPLAEAAP